MSGSTMTSTSTMTFSSSTPTSHLYDLIHPITLPPSESTFTNWGQTFSCTPLKVFKPENEEQCCIILEIARREGRRVRAAGVGHSPSDLACTEEFMVVMTGMRAILEINTEKKFVIAQGGIVLNDLHTSLSAHNLAMSNLGSISDQTLAGVVTTPTHGSGIAYGVIGTHVIAITLLLADGRKVRCSNSGERKELFTATLCGLGSTGLILNIEMEVEERFNLRDAQEMMDFDDVVDNLDAIVRSSQHTRLWWFQPSNKVRVSRLDRTSEPRNPSGSWFWDVLCAYHLIQFLLFIGRFFPRYINPWTSNFAAWLVSKPSVNVDESHRVFNVNCRYPQHTTEWALPYTLAPSCLRALRTFFDEEFAKSDGIRPHFPLEIRFSAPDDIWLSPSEGSSGGGTCWLGIVMYKPYTHSVPYRPLFASFERILSSHSGRPHWAKAHSLTPSDLREKYPRFDEFVAVLEDVDPRGMFRNPYVRRHFFGEEGDRDAFRVSPDN